MCGIFGLFCYNKKEGNIDPLVKILVQRFLMLETLVDMETRGTDSTGAAILWDDKKAAVVKQPVSASFFAKNPATYGQDYINPKSSDKDFAWFMNLWLRKLGEAKIKQVLGHVRKGTKGDPHNPHNNHPIIISSKTLDEESPITEDTVVGIHNGGITNDDALFKKHNLTRIGSVDSEIIFQLMAQYKNDYTISNLKNTHTELLGEFASIAFTVGNTSLAGCMREGQKPIEAAFIPALGDLVLVSEQKYLIAAIHEYERWRNREHNTHISIVDYTGNKVQVGKVGDVFPYLTTTWYGDKSNSKAFSSVEPGVFILDLDNEVDDKTIPEDLVKVEKIYSYAKSNTTTTTKGTYTTPTTVQTMGYHSNAYANNPTKAVDTRAASTEPPIIATKTGSSTDIHILSTCEDGELIDLTANIESENIDETMEIEIREDLTPNDEDEEDECPYGWDDCHRDGLQVVYGPYIREDNRTIVSKINTENIKDLLAKWLIEVKDETEAVKILGAMYETIFPEGYAYGFKAGYCQCANDLEDTDSTEETSEDESINNNIDELKTLNVKLVQGLQVSNTEKIKLGSKLESAEKKIRNMKMLLASILQRGKLFESKGQIDKQQIHTLFGTDAAEAAENINKDNLFGQGQKAN